MKPLDLPTAYVPFAKLKIVDILVCDAMAIVTVDGLPPLLLGDGPILRVWLSVPGEPEFDTKSRFSRFLTPRP